MLAMFNILITGSRVYEEPFSYPDCTKRDLEGEEVRVLIHLAMSRCVADL